jgi:hypothetical protein
VDKGGWVYDYFEDGSIAIVDAPKGHERAVGKRLRGGDAYNAILRDIEPQVTAALARRQSSTTATVGAVPWKTYGEKLVALKKTLNELLAEGMDAESDEIEEIREDLAEAAQEVQVFGPDEAMGADDDMGAEVSDDDLASMDDDDDVLMGDDMGGRDPGNEDDLDEAFEDAMGDDDMGDDDMGDDDMGDDDMGDDDMGAGDPGDDIDDETLDEILGDTDDLIGQAAK